MQFTIDTNTVLLAFIASLMTIIGWFTRKWALGIELQLTGIHADMKDHNDRSDRTHDRIFKAIALDAQRISKIEGQLED